MRSVLFFIGVLLAPLLLYLLYGAGLWVLGYEFAKGPDVLAERLVGEDRPAKDCFLYRTLDLWMRPSTYELQMECVYDYASLTKDPEVCELLLPGEYGLACLSEVGGGLKGPIPCIQFDGENELYCNATYSEGELTIQNPQIQNCSSYERKDIQEWCYYMRTSKLREVYECNQIENQTVRDNCEVRYAFKQKDPSLCAAVKDEKRRKYCEIRIGTWLKYPDLRSSFYFGTPVPVDEETIDMGSSAKKGPQPHRASGGHRSFAIAINVDVR